MENNPVRTDGWRRHLAAFLVSAAVLIAVIVGIVYASWPRTGARLVYALDDAYIHMAIARNVVCHHVYGVTRYGFSASSSSVLWPWLLAGVYGAVGVNTTSPLWLNLFWALLLLWSVGPMLRHTYGRIHEGLLLLRFIVFVPLPALIVAGMEHVLHVYVTIVFAALAAGVLEADGKPRIKDLVPLMASGALLAAVRYEGLFLVAAVCFLLLLRRRVMIAVWLGIVSWLPVVVSGLVSIRQGWGFFPNSLLLKSNPADGGLTAKLRTAADNLVLNPHIWLFVVFALAVLIFSLRRHGRFWSRWHVLPILFLLATGMHLLFAQVGWFYRYEAYLVGLGIFACVPLGTRLMREHESRRVRAAIFFLSLALTLVLAARGARAIVEAPQAMEDRYLEHVIPAEFVHTYYNEDTVVVNDIGAICFFTDAHVLDLFGLGNREPIEFRARADGYGSDDLDAWAAREGVTLAILQTEWGLVRDRIPGHWRHVAEWRIPRNVVFGDRTVAFYVPEGTDVERLTKSLEAFMERIPARVGFGFVDESEEEARALE